MAELNLADATRAYWERDGLGERIRDMLVKSGKDLTTLTVDDLAAFDQFHNGGKPATDRLAGLGKPAADAKVLDVGGGLGGPARTIVARFGCTVDVLDLTESYIQAGEMLTGLLGLTDKVRFHVGDALAIPFPDESYDVVWTQNSGMNIEDKARLYQEFHRMLRPGGKLVTQEPMAGPVQPALFPAMWARDTSSHFLLTPDAMRAVMESAGFRTVIWDDITAETAVIPSPPPMLQQLIMGDVLPLISATMNQNYAERRLVNIQAVLERT